MTASGFARSRITATMNAPTKGPNVGARFVSATTTEQNTAYGIPVANMNMALTIPTIRASTSSQTMNLEKIALSLLQILLQSV